MRWAWSVAWRNLRRNRKRNIATLAAIAFGYAGLVLLGGYAVRVERFLKTNAVFLQHTGHVAVWKRGGLDRAAAEPDKYQLDAKEAAAVLALAKNDARVELATRYLTGVGMAGNACTTRPAQLLGVEPGAHKALLEHPELAIASPELAATVQGRWPYALPGVKNGIAVAVGLQTILQKPKVHDETVGHPPAPTVLACDTPDAVTQLAADADVQLVGQTYDGTMNAVDGEMTATFHAPEPMAENTQILMPLVLLQQLYATDNVTYIGLILHDSHQAQAVATDLQTALAKQGHAVETYTYTDATWAPMYVGTMAFLGSMVGFITLLVSAVLVFTVAGAMTLAILERTREIGTWRSLGFERRHVSAIVVREAILLSIIGLAIGLAIGVSAALAINAANIRFAPPGVAGTIQLMITPAVWACLAQAMLMPPGIALATWWVVRGQLKKKPVELLTAATG